MSGSAARPFFLEGNMLWEIGDYALIHEASYPPAGLVQIMNMTGDGAEILCSFSCVAVTAIVDWKTGQIGLEPGADVVCNFAQLHKIT